MKYITKSLIFIIFAGLFFTSCEKDEGLMPEKQIKEDVVINASKTFTILKAFTITKYDSVYFMQTDMSLIKCRTIKIRDIMWNIAQEWLLDNLKTDGIPEYYDGQQRGYYYPWHQIESSADNNDFNYIVCDANYNPLGFHLPKADTYGGANDGDITKLASILGSTALIRQKLELARNGFVVNNNTILGANSQANIWLEVRGTLSERNKVKGCGVFARWDSNDVFWHVYTNISNAKLNVRLVRDITPSEW